MISINFFEKEEVNILPYIAASVFFLLLLLISLYLISMRAHYKEEISEANSWIVAQEEEISLARRISQYDREYEESIRFQEELTEKQYPMDRLVTEIVAEIPDEMNRVTSFQHEGTNQLSLVLENTTTVMGKNIVEDIEQLPYIEEVQFLRADNQGENDGELRFELLVDLNERLFAEEVEE